MPLLKPGDTFPKLTVNVLGGKTLTVPDAFEGHYATLLFNRGSWCPYCNAQLRAFQRASDSFAEAGILVASLSVDDEPTAQALADKIHLTFPLGYGADAHALAELTGAFVNPDPVFVQSTGFLLDPEGKVMISVYSSGAIGRLVPEDVLGMVKYAREHAAK
ncbi:MAG: peroxiredoxin family protein [Actinocrinis sp.]